MKRIISILLCIAMVISMTACGQTGSVQETASPADSYLKMAEDLVAQEKYDSAIDVLNQAKAQVEDARLDAMIAEIENSRPVLLEVEYEANSDNLKTKGIQIHEVTAQVLGDVVRYDIAYTAPEGMYLQVMNTNLYNSRDYQTSGGKGVFTFEVGIHAAKAVLREMTVQFRNNGQDYMELAVNTDWPDMESVTVEIPVTNDSAEACRVDMVTVTAVEENLFHYHVEYFTDTDKTFAVSVALDEEPSFLQCYASPGEDMIGFTLDRDTVEATNQIRIDFVQDGGKNELHAQLLTANYDLPQAAEDTAAEETLDTGFANDGPFHATSVTVRKMYAGNLYTIHSNARTDEHLMAYCSVGAYAYLVSTPIQNGKPQQLFFPAGILAQCAEETLYAEYYDNNFWYVDGVPAPSAGIVVELNVLSPDASYQGMNPVEKLDTILKDAAEKVTYTSTVDLEAAKAVDTSAIQPLTNNADRYLYMVVNTKSTSEEDLAAARAWFSDYTDVSVLEVDCAGIGNAQDLYALLQADSLQRGGEVAGVQLIGHSGMVPTFTITYKVEMPDSIGGPWDTITDYFYGNFANNTADLNKNYNVVDHLTLLDLMPQWPVVRLPLARGEIAPFFAKYEDFMAQTGGERLDLVNFDNPIFASTYHVDDFGIFLTRMDEEFDLLDVDYRIYGNLDGEYPVQIDVEGNSNEETMAAENKRGSCEFLINSEGNINYLVKTYFENGSWKSGSLLHSKTEATTFGSNYYYLAQWGTSIAANLKDNLASTALKGNAVGVFGSAGAIANNGISCFESVEQMSESNLFYFFLHYLKAMNEGNARAASFFAAQQSFAAALITYGQDGLNYYQNYQMNLYNLMGYHNMGILESDSVS